MSLDETIDQLKIKGFRVFKDTYPNCVVTYRETTLEETLYLDKLNDTENARSLPIVRSIVIDVTGDVPIEDLYLHPQIVKQIIKNVRSYSRFSNEEKIKEEYQRVNKDMDENYLESLIFWISRQLSYPEFMYVSKNMSPAEFMRHVVLAEVTSGLAGFFMYGITSDESQLSEDAKRMIFPDRYRVDQRPLWQQAGLPHEPMNIQEARVLKQYIHNMKAGELHQPAPQIDELPAPVVGRGISAAQQIAIQIASKKLAQQVRADEMAVASGRQKPKHYNWDSENDALEKFEQ